MLLHLLSCCLGLCAALTPSLQCRRCPSRIASSISLRFQDGSSADIVSLNETLAPMFLLEDDNDDSLPLFSGIVKGLAQKPVGALRKEETAFLVRFFQKAPGWIPRTIEAAIELETILKRLIDEKYHGLDIEITAETYAAVAEVWALVGVPRRAQEIHDAMKFHNYEPTIESYNALLLAWGMNLTHVESIWDEIMQRKLQPIARTFYRMLDAYSRALSGNYIRSNATAYIERCEELFESMSKYGVQRNIHTFMALQRVYCRSDLPDAGDKVLELLKRLREMYIVGDDNAKPHVMNCNRESSIGVA
jgi:Pentatricopeptide repeat domain